MNDTITPFRNFSVEEAREEVDEIYEEAEQKARKVIELARERAEEILKEAQEEGYRKGFEKGKKEGKEEGRQEGKEAGKEEAKQAFDERVGSIEETLTKVVSEVEEEQQELQSRARNELLELLRKIARTVLKTEAHLDLEPLKRNIEKAVDLAAEKLNITILIPVETRSQIEEFLPELKKKFDGLKNVELKEDEELEPGSCIIHSGSGRVEARIEEQIQEIENILIQEVQQEKTEENGT